MEKTIATKSTGFRGVNGRKLKKYQEKGVQNILEFLYKGKSSYCADEQGLGKTVQAIEALNRLERIANLHEDRTEGALPNAKFPPIKSTLILCPKVVLYNWKIEIERWYEGKLKVRIIDSTKELKALKRSSDYITILPYSLLSVEGNYKYLKKFSFSYLVCDEIQQLKGYKSARAISVFKHIWSKCIYKVALSGTPFKQNVVDGFNVFNAMAPHIFQNYQEFAARYSHARVTPWAVQYTGIRNSSELRKLIRDNFYFRRTVLEVGLELPPKLFIPVHLGKEYLPPTPKTEKEKLEREILEIQNALNGNKKGDTRQTITTSLAGERRMQGEYKVPAVVEFVRDKVEEGIPIVLFAYHKNVIASIAEGLKKYKPVVITGETSSKNRQKAVEDFQTGKSDVFIGQIVASGVGITLTRSHTIVFSEITWSPDEISQAISRCYRIGTDKSVSSVNIYYFCVEDSIDNMLIDTVMRKADEFAQVV